MKGIERDYLIGIFLNGLKEDIKAEVKLYKSINLVKLMMKAQVVEEKNQSYSKIGTHRMETGAIVGIGHIGHIQ